MKLFLSLLTFALLAPLVALRAAEPSKPNIILILADDFGLPDIGCYGSAYKTPNLDALAAGGTRFEYCFAAPLCAPSRAMCMFGAEWQEVHVTLPEQSRILHIRIQPPQSASGIEIDSIELKGSDAFKVFHFSSEQKKR